ncbi:MAG: rod shape-determining protein MreC [Actinomycetota bacterium]|nr:rod shape-determining protein MreC [Actinomycetota bacterium]
MATYGRVRSTRLLVVLLLVASLVTITIDARGGDRGPLAAAGRTFGSVVGTLQEGVATVFRPVGSFFTNVFRAGALAERVRVLEQENAGLQSQLSDVATLRAENAAYERILGLTEELRLEPIGAAVVAESVGPFEWSVVINKGADDGVIEDMPVVAAEGLVGRVIEVYESQAKVMLIIDPDSRVTARLSSSRDQGLIVGQREESLRLDLIGPEIEIVPGEIVETSGFQVDEFEGLFPPGIQIGQVERVEPSDDGITVHVLIRPNVDFSRLDRVAVVTGVERIAPEAGAPPTREEVEG